MEFPSTHINLIRMARLMVFNDKVPYVDVYRSVKTKSQRENQITPERATDTS